ncbi:MAG TPA: DUF4349 domain-containing protein [Solirubrobacteraceae bacterium]|jgi:hypothetical protein
MRIVPFPSRTADTPPPVAELPEGYLKQLESDLCAMAPRLDPDFERELRARLSERTATARGRGAADRWRRPALVLAAALVIVPVAVVVPAELGSGNHRHEAVVSRGTSATAHATEHSASVPLPSPAPGTASAAAEASGRLQQLSASITLAAQPGHVQQLADEVSRLTVGDGGFVAHSNVQEESAGQSEAQLTLQLPSAHLSAALAALGRLAPVRAESQSLQDITTRFDSARQRRSDLLAERRALLHALSLAQTQGAIESLRERLAQTRSALARAVAEVAAAAHSAATSRVEVGVVSTRDSDKPGTRSTLVRGLHTALHVLVVTLIVLLTASAVLVPLCLLLLAAGALRRLWLRAARERVLERG